MQKNKKMIIGGAVVASCIAAGAIYAVESNQSQFDSDVVGQSDYEFMSYVSAHGKKYSTKTEWKARKARWAKTDAAIKAHNADPSTTSGAHHNFMSDYTEPELKNSKGYDTSLNDEVIIIIVEPYDPTTAPTPLEIDWVSLGYVTPIQR